VCRPSPIALKDVKIEGRFERVGAGVTKLHAVFLRLGELMRSALVGRPAGIQFRRTRNRNAAAETND
jgi:hypothetical protein